MQSMPRASLDALVVNRGLASSASAFTTTGDANVSLNLTQLGFKRCGRPTRITAGIPADETAILVDESGFPHITGMPGRANIIKCMAWPAKRGIPVGMATYQLPVVRLTVLLDRCHSVSMPDLPYCFVGFSGGKTHPPTSATLCLACVVINAQDLSDTDTVLKTREIPVQQFD
ncbi:hypothetical protein CGC20_23895 [Leishmania donovani]|uniref:Uncharacterized protein n=1 Tax=Leishmania donovani TaxID=5661 RepID=A0A504X5F2_LEIDO|nr:hypothetical protein CGC20_23895 [Leishmania donovani]